jgi:RNA polymerase sigma factor (sigma-70 family)
MTFALPRFFAWPTGWFATAPSALSWNLPASSRNPDSRTPSPKVENIVEFAPPADYGQIVEQHYRSLYLFALSLARNEHDAWDLTHETMLKWVHHHHRIRDRAKTKTWLFTALYRTFLDLARRRRRHDPHDPIGEVFASLPDAVHEVPAARSLDQARVMALLGGLPERLRAPLTLFYLEDCSYHEIARILSIRPGTVMSRLSRAKAVLAERIERSNEDLTTHS